MNHYPILISETLTSAINRQSESKGSRKVNTHTHTQLVVHNYRRKLFLKMNFDYSNFGVVVDFC